MTGPIEHTSGIPADESSATVDDAVSTHPALPTMEEQLAQLAADPPTDEPVPLVEPPVVADVLTAIAEALQLLGTIAPWREESAQRDFYTHVRAVADAAELLR